MLSVSGIADFRAHQNTYSLLSASTALLFALSSLPHLIWSPLATLDQIMLIASTLTGFTLFVVILVQGTRFSLFTGLYSLALAMVGIYLFIGVAVSEQVVLNAILLVPVVALMMGWFVPKGHARAAMLVAVGILLTIVFIRRQLDDLPALTLTTTIYTALLTGFLFEVGTFVHRHMEQRASNDPLTGALNRFGFSRDGAIELRRSLRQGYPVTMVAIDFDEFKRLNDTQGHLAGDQVLRQTIAQWRVSIRPYDLIVRVGGDEFALLLVGMPRESADVLVRRLRHRSEVPWSWGIADWDGNESLDDLLERADAELLRSRLPT